MADDDKVIFDRKTAAVLMEMARWWQSNPQYRQPPPAKRSTSPGNSVVLAEVVTADVLTHELTVKLLYGSAVDEDVAYYADLADGPTVDARNWMSPRGVDSDSLSDGTVLPVLEVGQKVLVANVNGLWGVVGILSGAFVDLLNPEDASSGWNADTPGVLTTSGDMGAGRPYTYVLNTLASLLTACMGSPPGTDGNDDYVLCVHCNGTSNIEYVFYTPLSAVANP